MFSFSFLSYVVPFIVLHNHKQVQRKHSTLHIYKKKNHRKGMNKLSAVAVFVFIFIENTKRTYLRYRYIYNFIRYIFNFPTLFLLFRF